MLLAEVYSNYRAPLLASLQSEYRIGLHDRPMHEVADMVAWLPPGCALWRAVGGPLSLSSTDELLMFVDFRLRYLLWQGTKDGQSNRNRPDPPKTPPYADARKQEQAHAERQADAYRRRTRKS